MPSRKERLTIVMDKEMLEDFNYIKEQMRVKQNKTVMKSLIRYYMHWQFWKNELEKEK